MRGRALLFTWSLVGIVPAAAQTVDTTVSVPLRDGVRLGATLLLPAAGGRFPTLVYRTPYGQETAVRTYSTFRAAVAHGYAVLAVDVRGRYTSEGEFDPYRQEGRDGYDTIEWAAGQAWSDGAVGTFGLSYPGAVQWLAAVEHPPHLRAMVPAMTFSRPTNFWYAGGLTDLSWPAWIWLNIAPDVRARKNLPGPRTRAEARTTWGQLGRELTDRLPVTDAPELRDVAPWYFEWLSHPPTDPWWRWADLTSRYDRVGAAVLNLSGWHDDNYGPEGAVTNHLGLMSARRGADDPRSFLIVGPWVHGTAGMNDRTSQAHAGERVFGAEAGIDYDAEILRFMDRYVRGLGNGVERGPRIRVFVMGENVWRTADRWPLPGTERVSFYLSRTTPAGPGALTTRAPSAAGRAVLRSDPAHPVVDPYDAAGGHDYRSLTARDDVLVFETEPLTRDLRVVGNIEASLAVSVDAPDADVWVKLLDVAPNGTAWNLMSPGLDALRLSYRDGRTHSLLEPGRIYQVSLPNLLTGNRFAAGHRIRVVIMPSFMPWFGRNLQTGLSETESAETRPARISLHWGPDHPSRIVLPIVP